MGDVANDPRRHCWPTRTCLPTMRSCAQPTLHPRSYRGTLPYEVATDELGLGLGSPLFFLRFLEWTCS